MRNGRRERRASENPADSAGAGVSEEARLLERSGRAAGPTGRGPAACEEMAAGGGRATRLLVTRVPLPKYTVFSRLLL